MKKTTSLILWTLIALVCFVVWTCIKGPDLKEINTKDSYENEQLIAAPKVRNTIIDNAGLLHEDHAFGLSRAITVFLAKFNLDFMVVVEPQLNGKEIEKRAIELYDEHIKENNKDRGVLLLVAKNEGAIKFEVGYDLEDVFTDMFCGWLARNTVESLNSPDDAVGQFNGLMLSLGSRLNLMKDKYTEALVRDWEKREFKSIYYGSGGAGAKAKLEDLATEKEEVLSDEQRAKYKAGTSPKETLDVFEQALEDMVKDPYLDIYANSTQVMKHYQGWDFFSSAKYLATLKNAKPFDIEIKNNYAVVKPSKSYPLGWTIFLQKGNDGLWRLDEVRLVQQSIIDADGLFRVNPKRPEEYDYMYSPYSFAYDDIESDYVAKQQALAELADGRDMFEKIKMMQLRVGNDPTNWMLHFSLARLYLSCNAIDPAYESIEKAVANNPGDKDLYLKAAHIVSDYNYMYRRSLRWLTKAYDLGDRGYRTLYDLGFYNAYFGDGRIAENYLDELVKLKPWSEKKTNVQMAYALAYHYQGDENREKLARARAFKDMPDSYKDYYMRLTSTEE